jgi:hypothetical protein
MREKITLFFRRLLDVTPACLMLMTQGNLAAITLAHWEKALGTGSMAGAVLVLLSFYQQTQWLHNQYVIAALTGLAAGLVDGISHPANFKGEAIMTGIAAAGLCLLFSVAFKCLEISTNSK